MIPATMKAVILTEPAPANTVKLTDCQYRRFVPDGCL